MNYQICTRCVMDNASDPTITFDENGYCNYCTTELNRKDNVYFPNEEGKQKWDAILAKIKEDGKDKPYDCLMGISGGLDSSYLAYLGYKWGLRILAVHIDDGNVPDIAIPQDNILFAALYKYARKYKIKYFLSGGNFALESILQQGNTYTAYDVVNIKDIHRHFGTMPMNKLPLLSNYRKFWDKKILHIESLRPLNYIDYNRERALKELNDFCDFEYYGSKHMENTLTKFIQVWWFYNRYGVDKRRSHLSSMIVSGQMTRDEALKELQNPPYNEDEMKEEIAGLLPKLGISEKEFEEILKQPPKQHTDYKIDLITKIVNKLRIKG